MMCIFGGKMKRLGFINTLMVILVFFTAFSVLAGTGTQNTSTGDPSLQQGGTENCPPPQVIGYDSTFYLCEIEDICFDVVAINALGDSLKITQIDGPGVFETLTDTSGQTCFTPDDVDSATYIFTYSIERVFGCKEGGGVSLPLSCPQDTIFITVIKNQPPWLDCPGLQNFSACEPDTFCFPIAAFDPEQGRLTFNVLSGNAFIEEQTVCIAAVTEDSFDVIIEVVDECDLADTCVVPVKIDLNHTPYVTMADDFSVAPCVPETICFDATADDVDFDIVDISVNYGHFDDYSNRICFEADTSGRYVLILTAVDSCEATDSDTTIVTVTLNEPPLVDLGNDTTVQPCGGGEVCIDVFVSDDNLNRVVTNYGTYDQATDRICFAIDTAGIYEIILEAWDDCELTASDTVMVTVLEWEVPFVNLGPDFTVPLCQPDDICVFVETIEAFKSVTANLGTFNAGSREVCFRPDTSGIYTMIVQVTDSCDFSAADTVNIEVVLNSPPVVSGLTDTSLYLCFPQEICLPVSITDPDGDIDSIWVSRGSYHDGQVCFVPYDSGRYEIIVTASDSCGNLAADTAIVVIETDQGIEIICPDDTVIFTCNLIDTFCLPVYGIPENAEVTVSGINGWYDAETEMICFWSECSNVNHLGLSVTTPCNTFTCDFYVTIKCNSDPLVILSPDTTIALCESGEICLPVGIDDVDDNLANVVVSGGTYNPVNGRICFAADTIGSYVIQVTAIDSCGAIDTDEITVSVTLNSPPEITEVDTTIITCSPEEVCLPVNIIDIDNNLEEVTTSLGFWDYQSGRLCFLPDTAGRYCIKVIARDACQAADTAEVCVCLLYTSRAHET